MTMLAILAFIGFGFAGWGFLTSIGLLKLKPWARVSALIFSGIVAVNAFFFVPLLLSAPLWEANGISANSIFAFCLTLDLLFGTVLGIAIWWLALFSRGSTTEQFLGTRTPVERPIGITIIAWIAIAFPMINLLSILTTRTSWIQPEPLFLTIITGVAARVYRRLFLPLSFAAGIGLLWNKVWGYWLAVGLDVFYLLNLGVFFLLPNGSGRWQKFLTLSLASRLPEKIPGFYRVFLLWIFIFGSVEVLVFLSVLLSGKKRYFAIAAGSGDVIPAAS
jgi:hypothetical protein